MSRPRIPRAAVIACLASCVLAGVLGVLWLRARGFRIGGPTKVVDARDAYRALFERRSSRPERPPAPSDVLAEGPRPLEQLLPALDERELEVFFPGVDGARVVLDPHSYVALKGGVDHLQMLDEHPDGRFPMRTNALGMRRDGEPASTRPAVRVLVTGDSHTDGVVANPENLCALLETRLAADLARSGRAGQAEVLNAGSGGFTFINYLGTLERFAYLEPHAFVAIVYGGNDFYAQMLLERYLRGLALPNRDADAIQRVLDRGGLQTGLLAQDLLQALYFARNPEDEALARASALEYLLAMRARSEAIGARFLCVYLPPVSSGQPEQFRRILAEGLELTHLERDAYAVSDRIADALLADLAQAGVATVDLRAALRALRARGYWRADMHLSLEGHRAAAEAIGPVLEALLNAAHSDSPAGEKNDASR